MSCVWTLPTCHPLVYCESWRGACATGMEGECVGYIAMLFMKDHNSRLYPRSITCIGNRTVCDGSSLWPVPLQLEPLPPPFLSSFSLLFKVVRSCFWSFFALRWALLYFLICSIVLCIYILIHTHTHIYIYIHTHIHTHTHVGNEMKLYFNFSVPTLPCTRRRMRVNQSLKAG